jgi:sarcosine oxidase, subunit beta
MDKITEIVIVGAGVVGASCAAHLARAGRQVVVIDARSEAAAGSTGRSFGAVRGQWADPMNVALSWASLQRLPSFGDENGVDIGYRPIGYLMLISYESWANQLAAVELQHSYGVPVEVLSVVEASAITPLLHERLAYERS